MKNCKLFVVYCLLLKFTNCHSDMKKSWLSTKSSKNQLAPNLEPDLPKFTPFNSEHDDNDSIKIYNNSDDNDDSTKLIGELKEEDDVMENNEQFQLNADDETFIDKLLPFSDYIYDIYDNLKKNSKVKKHKKMYKSKQHAEKNQDQNHDDNIDNEFTTENLTIDKREEEDGAITIADYNNKETVFSEDIGVNDNGIVIDEDQSTETTDTIWQQSKMDNNILEYNIGPGVNVSLDVPNEMVRVQLDENCLKDVFTGRGKKKELITKTLALFVLPFLIQTSFVPFLLSTIKLMLVNSMVVGKIAILLFLVALFKNHKLNSMSDGMPYYLDTSQSQHLHHRRSEPDNKGYLAVGKPATYIT